MKISHILAMGSIMAIAMLTGCASTESTTRSGGPAKTTLDPMENVGPIVEFQKKTKLGPDGKVVSADVDESFMSPEAAQFKLRLKEVEKTKAPKAKVKKTKKKNGVLPPYWWQTQTYAAPTSSGAGGQNIIWSTGGGVH